ncbi:hypothetical protein WR25_02381 [Diploscapter pachys]|uniref:Uncharacterized protein n=1 Tax=Diploscapter pachys TaxID=2018661 RepID=A0A2A2LLR3_9BILA|nr:hypothetical protein WR25_02381 [Diploscapter pachys]
MGGLYANFKEDHMAPSYVYVLQYEMLCLLHLFLPIIAGCCTCTAGSKYEAKDNNTSPLFDGLVDTTRPWSISWLNLYLFIPISIQYYQFGMMFALLMPLLQIDSYDFPLPLSLRYVDAYLSHKFALTPMSIVLPAFFLLPPIRSFFLKPFIKRFRRNDRIATPRPSAETARRATTA